MAMKLVKQTAEYSIYKRGDNRYAVKDASKKPVNAEEKVRILVAEGLVVAVPPSEPEFKASEASIPEEAATGEASADEGVSAAEAVAGDAEAGGEEDR